MHNLCQFMNYSSFLNSYVLCSYFLWFKLLTECRNNIYIFVLFLLILFSNQYLINEQPLINMTCTWGYFYPQLINIHGYTTYNYMYMYMKNFLVDQLFYNMRCICLYSTRLPFLVLLPLNKNNYTNMNRRLTLHEHVTLSTTLYNPNPNTYIHVVCTQKCFKTQFKCHAPAPHSLFIGS